MKPIIILVAVVVLGLTTPTFAENYPFRIPGSARDAYIAKGIQTCMTLGWTEAEKGLKTAEATSKKPLTPEQHAFFKKKVDEMTANYCRCGAEKLADLTTTDEALAELRAGKDMDKMPDSLKTKVVQAIAVCQKKAH